MERFDVDKAVVPTRPQILDWVESWRSEGLGRNVDTLLSKKILCQPDSMRASVILLKYHGITLTSNQWKHFWPLIAFGGQITVDYKQPGAKVVVDGAQTMTLPTPNLSRSNMALSENLTPRRRYTWICMMQVEARLVAQNYLTPI